MAIKKNGGTPPAQASAFLFGLVCSYAENKMLSSLTASPILNISKDFIVLILAITTASLLQKKQAVSQQTEVSPSTMFCIALATGSTLKCGWNFFQLVVGILETHGVYSSPSNSPGSPWNLRF